LVREAAMSWTTRNTNSQANVHLGKAPNNRRFS